MLTPALVHWKAGHFAALIREEEGRFLMQDPTFGNDLRITRAALDDEGSGHFLVPEGPLPEGWTAVPSSAGGEIWGKGIAVWAADPQIQGGSCPRSSAMAVVAGAPDGKCTPREWRDYTVNLLLVNLHISDTPVGYQPPVGPAMEFNVAYNQREVFQPQIPLFSNLGSKWTFDWFSFVEDDPAHTSAAVNVYLRRGGQETYTGMARRYFCDPLSQSGTTRPNELPRRTSGTCPTARWRCSLSLTVHRRFLAASI